MVEVTSSSKLCYTDDAGLIRIFSAHIYTETLHRYMVFKYIIQSDIVEFTLTDYDIAAYPEPTIAQQIFETMPKSEAGFRLTKYSSMAGIASVSLLVGLTFSIFKCHYIHPCAIA